jgi:hypothetical protein
MPSIALQYTGQVRVRMRFTSTALKTITNIYICVVSMTCKSNNMQSVPGTKPLLHQQAEALSSCIVPTADSASRPHIKRNCHAEHSTGRRTYLNSGASHQLRCNIKIRRSAVDAQHTHMLRCCALLGSSVSAVKNTEGKLTLVCELQ